MYVFHVARSLNKRRQREKNDLRRSAIKNGIAWHAIRQIQIKNGHINFDCSNRKSTRNAVDDRKKYKKCREAKKYEGPGVSLTDKNANCHSKVMI